MPIRDHGPMRQRRGRLRLLWAALAARLLTSILAAAPPPAGATTDTASSPIPFGDAGFYGAPTARALAAPVVSMVATADGAGYWLAAADGGVFSFGDAGFYGSAAAATPLGYPVIAVARTPDGAGY